MTNTNRKIVLGVTGGIAAYKIADLVRLFKKAGDEVQVAMTAEASRFVTPLSEIRPYRPRRTRLGPAGTARAAHSG